MANLGYGETTFQNCNIGTPGTYTLSVTDPTDNINQPVLTPNRFQIAAGVPTQLKFITQPVNGTGGTPFATAIRSRFRSKTLPATPFVATTRR